MSDSTFFVETPRLFLSYLQPDLDSHCDFLVALYNSPEFIESIGGQPTRIVAREAARNALANRFRNEHARNGYGTYLISLKAEGTPAQGAKLGDLQKSTPIGTVGLMKGEKPDCYEAPDIGFAMLPAYMRKGYTKEGALGILDYLEREKGLKDVFGFHDPKNEASKAVMRSIGFVYLGERELKIFGDMPSAVWIKSGMDENLSVYGL
ncbi:hypothetical protein OQA88_11578 [Cercophora sp. LCS_1]